MASEEDQSKKRKAEDEVAAGVEGEAGVAPAAKRHEGEPKCEGGTEGGDGKGGAGEAVAAVEGKGLAGKEEAVAEATANTEKPATTEGGAKAEGQGEAAASAKGGDGTVDGAGKGNEEKGEPQVAVTAAGAAAGEAAAPAIADAPAGGAAPAPAEGTGAAPAAAEGAASVADGVDAGPTDLDRVISAIRHLKSHKGSSSKAIQKVCAEQYGMDDPDPIKAAIKEGVASGKLTQVKASFLVTGDPAYEDTSDKVSIEEKEPGEAGARRAARGDTATISYVGTLEDGGHEFDRSDGFDFEVGGGDVIKGMDAGVLDMKIGARRIVRIPPSLGYGKRGAKPDIPPNATLIFDITLLSLS